MRWIRGVGLWAAWAAAAWAGVFGTAVAIGGHASDIALDEARGVLYIANFNANRIEVMGLGDLSIRRSINVAAQPGALAVSPDGQFLVATHFGNFQSPNSPSNALTVIDLGAGTKQTYALGSPPLGVAFGIDNRALVATSTDFLLFDPVSGALETLGTPRDQALYVGDSTVDAGTAQRAGVDFIAVATGATPPYAFLAFPHKMVAASLSAILEADAEGLI